MSTHRRRPTQEPDDQTPDTSDWRLDNLELRAWRSLFAMQEQVRAGVERQLQANSALSLADYSVLVVLSEADGQRRRLFELCSDLRWEKSRLHHQLSRMSQRGIVRRHADPASPDSRAVYVELTDAGLTAITEAAPAHAREVRRLLIDHLGRHQLQQLAEIAALVIDRNCAESGEGAGPA